MIVVVHADRKTLRRKTQKDWEFEGSRGYTFSGLSSLLGERRLIKVNLWSSLSKRSLWVQWDPDLVGWHTCGLTNMHVCMFVCVYTYTHTRTHRSKYTHRRTIHPIFKSRSQNYIEWHASCRVICVSLLGGQNVCRRHTVYDAKENVGPTFPLHNPPWTSIEWENRLRIPPIPSHTELPHSLHKYFLRAHGTPAPVSSTYDADIEKWTLRDTCELWAGGASVTEVTPEADLFCKVASNATRTFGHLFCSNTKRTANRCVAMFQDSGNPSMPDCSESCWVGLACPHPCWSDLCLAENWACFLSAMHINNIVSKRCEAEMGQISLV